MVLGAPGFHARPGNDPLAGFVIVAPIGIFGPRGEPPVYGGDCAGAVLDEDRGGVAHPSTIGDGATEADVVGERICLVENTARLLLGASVIHEDFDAFVFGGLEEMGDRLGPINWQLAPSRPFDADDVAGFLDALPRELNGRPLRHVLEVRHRSFASERYVELARAHGVPTVFTDATQYPSFADLTGDIVYARLLRSAAHAADG